MMAITAVTPSRAVVSLIGTGVCPELLVVAVTFSVLQDVFLVSNVTEFWTDFQF